MKNTILIILFAVFCTSCKDSTQEADAYGNFEANEVIVSSETTGKVAHFSAEEGSEIMKDEVFAVIDTTLMALQRNELITSMQGIRSKLSAVNAQNEVLRQQIANIDINIARTEKMIADDAVPVKQMDDLTGQKAVILKQIDANNSQNSLINAELQTYLSKLSTLNEQISRAKLKSPLDGTLIQRYAEPGELVTAGKPVAKIADLQNMKLRVYVSGPGLTEIKTGQTCTVRIDDGIDSFKSYNGIITFISPRAEFTPKIIQTKEERVTLVYAVTIDVENDGSIKSGMPGEAIF